MFEPFEEKIQRGFGDFDYNLPDNLKEQLKRQSFTERHNTVTLRSWKADIRRIWSYVGVALTHSLQFAHRTVRGHECKKPISWHK
jgi:hypothetical protein